MNLVDARRLFHSLLALVSLVFASGQIGLVYSNITNLSPMGCYNAAHIMSRIVHATLSLPCCEKSFDKLSVEGFRQALPVKKPTPSKFYISFYQETHGTHCIHGMLHCRLRKRHF